VKYKFFGPAHLYSRLILPGFLSYIFVFSGIIREGENLLVGPLLDGAFSPAKVTSIHRYRVPRRMVRPGQAATLSLPHVEGNRLRKVDNKLNKIACFQN
jgi:GTPase